MKDDILGKANTRGKKAFFIFNVSTFLIFLVLLILLYILNEKNLFWAILQIPLIYIFLVLFWNGIKGVLSGKVKFQSFVFLMGGYAILTIGAQVMVNILFTGSV